MLLFPPIDPRPRPRPRRRRRERRTPPPAPPPPPGALALLFVDGPYDLGGDIEMTLVFDTTAEDPLENVGGGGADPGKWTARWQGQTYAGSVLSNQTFDRLHLQMSPTGAEAGADELSYSAAPGDIFDALGRQLGAFEGFAL